VDARILVTVGDATTAKLLSFGIVPDLSVVDGKERRTPMDRTIISPLAVEIEQGRLTYMECSNEAGSISGNAIATIKDALKEPFPVRVFVYGEEDMLAVPLFIMVPDGSVVLYGQPLEGMVIVKVNEDIRRKAQYLLDEIRAHE
jgi:GTP-dependent dephospho-CoA kinase